MTILIRLLKLQASQLLPITFRRPVIRMLFTIPLTVLALPAFSQAPATRCFCLRSAEGSLIRGCEHESKGPQDAYPTAFCWTSKGDFLRQTVMPGWKKIPAGTLPCDPCPTSPTSSLPERPRAPQ